MAMEREMVLASSYLYTMSKPVVSLAGFDIKTSMPGIFDVLQECLKDTIARVMPYWEEAIVPELKALGDGVSWMIWDGGSKHLTCRLEDVQSGWIMWGDGFSSQPLFPSRSTGWKDRVCRGPWQFYPRHCEDDRGHFRWCHPGTGDSHWRPDGSLGVDRSCMVCRSTDSLVMRVGLIHFVVSWWALEVCDGCWMTILPVQWFPVNHCWKIVKSCALRTLTFWQRLSLPGTARCRVAGKAPKVLSPYVVFSVHSYSTWLSCFGDGVEPAPAPTDPRRIQAPHWSTNWTGTSSPLPAHWLWSPWSFLAEPNGEEFVAHKLVVHYSILFNWFMDRHSHSDTLHFPVKPSQSSMVFYDHEPSASTTFGRILADRGSSKSIKRCPFFRHKLMSEMATVQVRRSYLNTLLVRIQIDQGSAWVGCPSRLGGLSCRRLQRSNKWIKWICIIMDLYLWFFTIGMSFQTSGGCSR